MRKKTERRKYTNGKKFDNRKCFEKFTAVFHALFAFVFFTDALWYGRSVHYRAVWRGCEYHGGVCRVAADAYAHGHDCRIGNGNNRQHRPGSWGKKPKTGGAEVIRLGGQYLRGYIWDSMFAGIHFSFSGYFCTCGRSELSFLHNIIAITLVRVPGVYLTSKLFPATLFPMGLATATGSLLSVIICVIAFAGLQKDSKKQLTNCINCDKIHN